MIKLICCDCNGVLEHIDHDYTKSGIYVDDAEIIGQINNFIFGTKHLLNSWMTGEITYKELNKLLSYKFNVDEKYLNDLLVQNMNDFTWNWNLINLFQKYRGQNIKVLMTTNNSDIFTLAAVPKNNFNKYFDKIYNSAEIKYLKEENDLRLFREISLEYKVDKPEILIIDDNKSIIKKADEFGYGTYLYNMETKNNFEKWFGKRRVSKMTDIQYIDAIMHGHFLYWDTLGNLRGIENHKEDGLRWLSGDVYWNYFTDTSDVDSIIQRMKNREIPNNLMLFANGPEADASETFTATGLFTKGISHNMAHNLMDTPIPKPDKRLDIFHVREISRLKTAGAILNAAFEYDLFTFGHYVELMENSRNVFYLAEYNGLPVGAVMAQHGDNFINISWVGTLPGYRKRGIAGHLIQAAERDGIQSGKTIGVLHSGPKSAGAYRRIGYREYCRGIDLHLIE